MQNCSKEYRAAMKKKLRNRANITIHIGVLNSEAQRTVFVDMEKSRLLYLSNVTKPFSGYEVEKRYATAEEGFALADGSFYFAPESGQEIYNQGLVTQNTVGNKYLLFSKNGLSYFSPAGYQRADSWRMLVRSEDGIYLKFSTPGLDIKGLTVDFGHCYPTEFTVVSDSGTKSYRNDSEKWSTEDTFFGTSFFAIIPKTMVNNYECRLRIHEFTCGITNTFTNKEVQSYSFKDYVSPIAETLPSQDMTVKIGNTDRYYCVDNPESAVNFMEDGAKICDIFSYELDDGSVERVVGHTTYLSLWSSDDKTAQFTAKDRLCYIKGTYRRGKYRAEGIAAYDLAKDIFRDAGVDERDYYLDPYLKNVIIQNPVPPVPHTQAMQILANACRCILSIGRNGQIRIESSFIPKMTVTASGAAGFCNPQYLLSDRPKDAYAMAFQGFSKADGSELFVPEKSSDRNNTGYVSELLSDENGRFSVPPVIAIDMEAVYTCYRITFRFRNVTPKEFMIRTYYEGKLFETYTVENPTEECMINEEFLHFGRIEFEFTKAEPHHRIVVDTILLDEVTNYYLEQGLDLMDSPKSARIEKTRDLGIVKTLYAKGGEKTSLAGDEIEISPAENRYMAEFSAASYGISASVETAGISVRIIEQSDYYALLEFSGMTKAITVKYAVTGYQYLKTEQTLESRLNPVGTDRTWKNPLISSNAQAQELMEWLGDYYLGDVEYQISDRGDPRQDANDIFYLELKDGGNTQIRAHQVDLKFNGAWSGTKKTRKVAHGIWRGRNRKPTG